MTNFPRSSRRPAFNLPRRLGLPLLLAAAALGLTLGGLVPGYLPRAQAEDANDSEPASEYTALQQRPDRLIVELPNRMIVVAQEVPTAPVVSAQIWVKTGSIFEQEYVGGGISHYLEHLLSGGTTITRSEAESNEILGRIGAQTNAATGLDNVRYYINTTSEHTHTAVDLLSDWIMNSTVEPSEVDRERDVIQQEFSMGEGDPRRLLWRHTQQARYQAHPARHPTIGYIDEFLEIDRDDLHDFYQRMYPPNNLVFVVSGDIDKQAVVDQIADLWQHAEPRELPEITFPSEPELDQPRAVTTRADVNRPQLRLAFPGTRLGAEHDYALDLLGVILGQGNASRLTRQLRDEQRLVNSIDAYNLSFPWGEGFFGIDAEVAESPVDEEADDPDARRIENLRQAVLDEFQRLREEPVSDSELDRAKRQILSSVLRANQSAEAMASRLARDIIATGDPDYLQRYAQRIQDLTAEDLQAAADAYFKPERLIAVELLPLPAGESPTPLTRDEDEADPDDFPQEAVDLDNRHITEMAQQHVAEAEDDVRPIEVEPLQSYELDNGLRVLVQRSTVVPAVSMQVFQKGGLLAEEPGREGIANATSSMLMRGTEYRDAQQLAQDIESLGASINTSVGNNTAYAQSSALAEDWPTVLNLLAEVMLEPAFAEDEWQLLQPRLLAAIQAQTDSWYGELNMNFRPAYFGQDHPWSQTPLGRIDVVSNLTVDDLREHHQRHLAAEDMVIAVVGDVDPDEVRDRVESLFGHLPPEADMPLQLADHYDTEPGITQIQTRKPIAAVKIGLGPAINRAHEDYATMQVLSRLMSAFPAGWLNQSLRGEGPGLAYAQWARLFTGLAPGYFEITFNSSPQLVPEALRRSMGVVERARQGIIGDEELQRARAGVLTAEFFSRQSNSDRAMSAALDELYGVQDPTGERFREQVQTITADQVQDAARQYLRDPVVLVLTQELIDEAELESATEDPADPDEVVEEDPDLDPDAAPEPHF